MSEATRQLAEWAAGLGYDDVPERVHERSKAQILSVVAAIHAGRHSEGAMSAHEAAKSWGSGSEATALATGGRLGRHDAIWANACASVAFDFDDYLFAGHTGHSAVCASLAYAELDGGSGRDVLASVAAANEVGGRLGASLLFGPHNGQMWSYIHLLEGACVAGRSLGLDGDRMAEAVGVAFTQPPYPLMPAFMGPDSKLLIPASTTTEGCRAAELAARGWTGSTSILEDPQGFLARFNRDNQGWMLSGFGRAWVSDSLTYKVVPGCAYVDTAVDSLAEIMASFEHAEGRALRADDVEGIEVACGMFTTGMEGFAQSYRATDRLDPITVNFSVALSFGLMLHTGTLRPEHLSHAFLDSERESIEAAAAKVVMRHDPALDARAAEASSSAGFSLGALLGAEEKSLDGASFEGYVMAFPAEVRVTTRDGDVLSARQDVPLGAAGRPWEETTELVGRKFLDNFAGPPEQAERALRAVWRLEEVDDVRDLVATLSA